ncbi:MAG: LacI family DNA-binding transcriptional regulator [Exiguobacterium mexicanum]
MATIKQVAKRANVSVATVSRVMNNNGYVSAEAREAVERAIAELDYAPNRVARSLFTKTSGLIGLIMPDITNPFFPQLARAIEDVANQHGYQVVLCNTDEQLAKEQTYLVALQTMHVDGLIITTNHSDNPNYEKLELPMVALDRIVKSGIDAVISDGYEGGRLAAETLLSCGATRLAHIGGPENLQTVKRRTDGFLDVAGDRLVGMTHSSFAFKEALTAAQILFDEHWPFDGVFAANDVIAAAVLQEALRRNVRVPEDLQIIGYDGIELGEMTSPPLTTISQPIYEMGRRATERLLDLIEKKETVTKEILLPVTLTERQTTIRKGHDT